MKTILEFESPEDDGLFQYAQKGLKLSMCIDEFFDILRETWKRGAPLWSKGSPENEMEMDIANELSEKLTDILISHECNDLC